MTHDGVYQITFQHKGSASIAMVTLMAGRIFGAGLNGVLYDGVHAARDDDAAVTRFRLRLTVPAGVALVSGLPARANAYSVVLTGSVRLHGETAINVRTPAGPVRANVKYLRDLPAGLAA